jgi:hypothetical protein
MQEGYKLTLRKILKSTQAAIAHFPTSYAQDAADLAKGFDGYDAWVTMSARCRFKLVLNAVVANLEHRIGGGYVHCTCCHVVASLHHHYLSGSAL